MSIETTEPHPAADGLVRVYPADAAAARPTAGRGLDTAASGLLDHHL